MNLVQLLFKAKLNLNASVRSIKKNDLQMNYLLMFKTAVFETTHEIWYKLYRDLESCMAWLNEIVISLSFSWDWNMYTVNSLCSLSCYTEEWLSFKSS